MNMIEHSFFEHLLERVAVPRFWPRSLAKVVEEQSRALQLDALRSSHPVEVPIRHAKAWQRLTCFTAGFTVFTAFDSITVIIYYCVMYHHLHLPILPFRSSGLFCQETT